MVKGYMEVESCNEGNRKKRGSPRKLITNMRHACKLHANKFSVSLIYFVV